MKPHARAENFSKEKIFRKLVLTRAVNNLKKKIFFLKSEKFLKLQYIQKIECV